MWKQGQVGRTQPSMCHIQDCETGTRRLNNKTVLFCVNKSSRLLFVGFCWLDWEACEEAVGDMLFILD